MRANGGLATNDRSVVPAPLALAALVVLGLLAVLLLPTLGADVPWETDPEPNASQLAVTGFGILLLTAGYVAVAARTLGWAIPPAASTFAYLAGIGIVKFVVSPASFHNEHEAELSEYVALGVGVMVLYLAALAVLYRLVERSQDRDWPRIWALGAVGGVLVFALASRYVAALAFGRDVGDYLADVFRGGGLWLPVLLVGSTLAAIAAFRHPERAPTFRAGLAVVVVYHGLWVAYVIRLFD